QELVALIKKRDSFYDWSDEYEKYDKKVKTLSSGWSVMQKKFDKMLILNEGSHFTQTTTVV
ncbi:hypothetical protein, partial [Bacillus atrophaeus]